MRGQPSRAPLTPAQIQAAIDRAQRWIGRIEARALRAIALGKRDV